MHKKTPTLLTAALIVITIVSTVSGLGADRKRRAAEKEADQLREQLGAAQAKKSDGPLVSLRKPIAASATVPEESGRVEELEAQLVELRGQLDAARADRSQNRQPRESWNDRMARMQQEDPEGYAEMMKQREERREQMRYDIAQRTAGFMQLDTASMSDAELENHNQLMEKMTAIFELSEKFKDPEYNPDRDTMRSLFQLTREARPLMDAERTVMFKQLGSELGMNSSEAEAFSTYVEGIIDTTTVRMPRGGGRDGGRDGGTPPPEGR